MAGMIPLSVLDLSPVPEGADVSASLANTLDLARRAEALGFHRYWLAEHHNMPGIASAATSVVIGAVAAATRTIRVGAGGIMLPNHAPYVIAEQFGTLNALYPGRIDLGLGRAPGSDMATNRALRRTLQTDVDQFPQDVVELMHWLAPAAEDQRIVANPGAGQDVPIWMLGSSTFGAQLAAHLGLPYAFASHFAPAEMAAAIDVYRRGFQPSAQQPEPYLMLATNVFAAETDEAARVLFSSVQQAFVNLRTGRPGKIPAPKAGFYEGLDADAKAMLDQALACSAVGSSATVKRQMAEFIARYQPDEIMVTTNMHDHAARVRSFEILADVARALDGSPSRAGRE